MNNHIKTLVKLKYEIVTGDSTTWHLYNEYPAEVRKIMNRDRPDWYHLSSDTLWTKYSKLVFDSLCEYEENRIE